MSPEHDMVPPDAQDFHAPDSVEEQIAENKRLSPEQTIENEKIFSEIDFKLLRGIFENIAARCGIEPADLNFIGPERIGFDQSPVYDTDTRTIQIAYNRLYPRAWAMQLPVLLTAIRTTAHEEAHAIGHEVCNGVSVSNEKQNVIYRVGFTEKLGTPHPDGMGGTGQLTYNILEEATTEKLARQVTLDYLPASGKFDQKDIDRFRRLVDSNDNSLAYPDHVRLLELMIDRIAKVTGFDKEFVWQGFISSKLRGQILGKDPDISSFMHQSFPQGFLAKLWGGASYNETLINEMIASLSEPDNTKAA